MDKKQLITQYCRQFRMSGIPEGIDQLVAEVFDERIVFSEGCHSIVP